jgi:hypothetical protein
MTVRAEHHFLLGVDPGQAHDPTGIVGLRFVRDSSLNAKCEVNYIHRVPLRTPYPDVARIVASLAAQIKLRYNIHPTVVVDLTGVGRPFSDMLQPALSCPLIKATITGGHAAKRDDLRGEWSVPKKVLVSTVAIALQRERLALPPHHPEAAHLTSELHAFKAKMQTSGHTTFEAWRDGDHDDLVLAAALAVWWSAHCYGLLQVVRDKPSVEDRMWAEVESAERERREIDELLGD